MQRLGYCSRRRRRVWYAAVALIGKCIEDLVSAKVRRMQNGKASVLDLCVLDHVHEFVLRGLKRLRVLGHAVITDRTEEGLGVHNSRVLVVAHNHGWSASFRKEADLLYRRLDAQTCEIHHIGSTSIPGLLAKPIIDIAIGLQDGPFGERMKECRNALENLGYRYLGDRGLNGGHMFEKEEAGVRTHAIQVHSSDSPGIYETLRFKRMLLDDNNLVHEYAEVKAALAELFPRNRLIYVWYKSHWLRNQLLDHNCNHAWARWLISANVPTIPRIIARSFRRYHAS